MMVFCCPQEVCVNEGHQRKGLGSQLVGVMKACVAHHWLGLTSEDGHESPTIRLWVENFRNKRSRQFFLKAGMMMDPPHEYAEDGWINLTQADKDKWYVCRCIESC
jgi:GNAT superfamily N-acetyltransferase